MKERAMGDGQLTMREQQVQARLGELLRALEQVESVITVAATALRHQNCERDVDVARVLQRSACDRLSVEIDKTGELLALFGSRQEAELEPADE
jgi:hypothetical protein